MPATEERAGYAARIAKNFVWLFLQLGVTRSFGFLFTLILARNLPQADFGRYTYGIGITGIFLILSDLGLMSLGLREIARHREEASAVFNRLFRVKAPLSLMAYLAFIAMMFISQPAGDRLAILLLATAFFAENMAGFMMMPFKATEQMQYAAIGDFVYKGLLIAGVLGVFLVKPALINVTAVYLACSTLYLLLYTVLYARAFGFRPGEKGIAVFVRQLLGQLRASAPIAFGGLIMVVYINADVIMLKWIKGEVATGLYGVSYSFYLGLGLAASILVQSVVPRLSRSFELGDTQVRSTVLRGTVKLLFLLSIPLACGGVLLSREIITFFYGARYLESETAFRFFMITVVFNYINLLISYYLFTQRKQNEINMIFLGTISLNIILNFLLIPHWSLGGAAAATLAAEVAFTLIFIIRHPEFCAHFTFSWIWRIAVAAAAMSAVVLVMRAPAGFIASLVAGAAVYGGIIWVLGTVRNEKDLIQGMFKKVPGGGE